MPLEVQRHAGPGAGHRRLVLTASTVGLALAFLPALIADACGSSDTASVLPSNPLPRCPDTPNCVRASRSYALPPDLLLERAAAALSAIGAGPTRVDTVGLRIDAVFTVFFFKDDVAVAVTPRADGGADLHIRSASRVGHGDLGVNRRRVRRFFAALEK